MLAQNLRIAARSLSHHKGYALTNIVGLAAGLAVVFLIVLAIQYEAGYDAFHANADRLYRISVVSTREGTRVSDGPEFTPPIGPAMAAEFPEVENTARLSTPRAAYLTSVDRTHRVDRLVYADSSLFELFSFALKQGDPRRALADPFSIVLTEEVALTIFGTEDPLGRVLTMDDGHAYTVSGVLKAIPTNSHIEFDALVSFSTLYRLPDTFLDWNGGNQYITYLLLRSGALPGDVERKLPPFMWNHINKQLAGIGVSLDPYLQPLKQIHLHYNDYSASLLTNLEVFAAVAVLILFIACANFVNLASARAVPRAKEIGVRKVLGASRGSLFRLFLVESSLLTASAAALAILLVDVLTPVLTQLLGRTISPAAFLSPLNCLMAGVVVLIVTLASGFYPALYLSSLEATRSLKGGAIAGRRKLRDALVVLQFAVSIALVACTLVVIRQLDYVKRMDLGFVRENVAVLPMIGDEAQSKCALLKAGLASLPGVLAVSASSEVPHAGFTSNGYFPEGSASPLMIHVVDVDDAFLPTFGLRLLEGRNFTASAEGRDDAYLINERLARTLGWEHPVGKTIRRNGDHTVIGVVKDFHYAPLYEKIEPLIITHRPWRDRFTQLSVKTDSPDLRATMQRVKEVWESVAPATPFSYSFLDDAVDRLYRPEQRFRLMFEWFSLIAILIAVIGLLGLVSMSIEQRTKEIGIRKVLGASAARVAALLSADVVRLVSIASVIAWPLAYVASERWLGEFAYRRGTEPWIFLAAALLALAVALATVSYRAVRAACANPVENLRYE